MKNFNDLNDTSKYLSHLIFKTGSMSSLLSYGLQNVYIDDYKHRCRYENCIMFLIRPNLSVAEYDKFQDKLISFSSFYDYYEIEKKTDIMYVYKVPDNLIEDYTFFKEKKFNKLTEAFWKSIGANTPLDFNHVKFDLSKEIYRFDTNLTLNRNKLLEQQQKRGAQ